MEIKRVKLFVNDNDLSKRVAEEVTQELTKYGFEIVNENFDLGISIGGDGCFLRMVKSSNFNENVHYIGINSGTLGFLQEINIEDTKDFVRRLSIGDYKEEHLSVQQTNIITEDKTYNYTSLNEVVVRSKYFNTLKIDVYVDDEFLEHFSGDGLLISTSTGSTAYNMSFGGSIVYNTLKTLSITPIAPLNNKFYKCLTNTVVIPDNKVIRLTPTQEHYNLFIMIDGENKEIDNVLKVETKVGTRTIKCLRMNDYHFIKIVNDKLLEK